LFAFVASLLQTFHRCSAEKKMGDTATIAAARAKYNKQDGFLYLTDSPHRVIWVNASSKLPELLLPADDITS
jgi:hypothetical protein